ncbi:MAG: hypothetical protein U0353_15740 [Sandaracinus sp.]
MAFALAGCPWPGGPSGTDDAGSGLDGGEQALDAATSSPRPRRVRLVGPWPQASVDESVDPRAVARAYHVGRRAASGTGTPFGTVSCAEGCSESCGLSFDVTGERRIADVQVVTAPDDRVYVHVLEGPSASRASSDDGMSSEILVASTTDDFALGRESITPDLADAFTRIVGGTAPAAENLRLVVRDMFVLGHSASAGGADTAHALVVFGHLFHRASSASAWSVRDAFLGIDPLTERLLFTASLPEEIFTQTGPRLPSYRALSGAISRDGRLLALRAGRVDTHGRIYAAPIPGLRADGTLVPEVGATHADMTEFVLQSERPSDDYDPLGFDLDDLDRIWSFGELTLAAPACSTGLPPPSQLRVRVHDASGAPIHELADPSRTFSAIQALRVERRADRAATWRVLALGERPRAPRCLDNRNQFAKPATSFTDDEDALDACPRRFEALCARDPAGCPCRACDGLLEECAPPLGGDAPQLLVAWSFDGSDDAPAVLSAQTVRAFAASGVTSFATNRRGRALLSGRGLSFLDLDAIDLERSLSWTVGGWDTTGGVFETEPISNLEGGWQSPLFDTAVGERFAAGLRSTHAANAAGPGASILRTCSEWGNIVTGTASFNDYLESRTIARERVGFIDAPRATREVDRVYPLARGRLLHVFHWVGPAADEGGETTLVHSRRLELRIAVPEDEPAYARGRDLDVPIGFGAFATRICEMPDDGVCGYPLGGETQHTDVSTEPPQELSCTRTFADGSTNPDCNPEALARAWATSPPGTLATTSSGRVAVSCTSAGLSTRTEPDGSGGTTLFATCGAFAERFQPDPRRAGDLESLGLAMLSYDYRPHAPDRCDNAGHALPLRLMLRSPRPRVSATDELGEEIVSVPVGVPAFVRIPAWYARHAHWQLLTGAASLSGGAPGPVATDDRTLDPSALLGVLPEASGAVVLSATLHGESGEELGTRTLALGFLGATPIVVNSVADAPLAAAGRTADQCATGAMVTPPSGSPVPECTLRAAIELVNARNAACGANPCAPARVFFDLPGSSSIIVRSVLPVLTAPAAFLAAPARPVLISPASGGASMPGLVARLQRPEDGVRLENLGLAGFGGALVEVQRMGSYGDGGIPTDLSPALVLAGCSLRDGGSDGAVTNGPLLLVVGARSVLIANNRGWGVRARQLSTHSPSVTVGLGDGEAFERIVIAENTLGGISLSGAVPRTEEDAVHTAGTLSVLADAVVEHNGGPGVVTTHSVTFASVSVSLNHGPGIALVDPADDQATVSFRGGLEASVVTSNTGDGISAEAGSVALLGPMVVNDNAGWGVRSGGAISAGDQFAFVPVGVSRNGTGPTCITVDLSARGALPTTTEEPCRPAGGILGTSDSPGVVSRFYDVTVTDNLGPGVIASSPLELTSVHVEGNRGPGVQYGSPRGSALVQGVSLGAEVYIGHNEGHGVSSTGTVRVSGHADVFSNGGSGLLALSANVVLPTVDGRSSIRDNGVGPCVQWAFTETSVEPAPIATACDLAGIVALDGDVTGAAFDVVANAGPGIWADAVTLTDVDICGHAEPLRVMRQTLTGVRTSCP